MRRKGRPPKYSPALVARALKEAHGFVAWAAELLGCTPRAIYYYAQRHPEVKRALEEAKEEMRRMVERKLYKRIMAGDPAAIALFLRTKEGRGIKEAIRERILRGGERNEDAGEETNGEGAAHTLP